MPSLGEIINELNSSSNQIEFNTKFFSLLYDSLINISKIRGNRNVIFYASAYLQKPEAPGYYTSISPEDINGFMSVMKSMDWSKNLTLLIHTPGGIGNAAQTIVEYLHQKFDNIEVIIPTYAMSAGTMISLASNNIIMGRQSQMGPIDPQLQLSDRSYSAKAIKQQFETAQREINEDPNKALVWAPILQSLGPDLLTAARDAIDYGEKMVTQWLESRMFHDHPDCEKKSAQVAKYFSSSKELKNHGQRISRDEAIKQGLNIEFLEDNDALQDNVLTAYHLLTIGFERTKSTKAICTSRSQYWEKIYIPPQ